MFTVRAYSVPGQLLKVPYRSQGILWPRGRVADGTDPAFLATRLVEVTATDADPTIGQIDPLTNQITVGPTTLAALQADPHLEVVSA